MCWISNFIVLHCSFNLLRIFKDGAHRSKTEFKLGPSSDVNLTSGTNKPHPTPCNCSALQSVRWQECELTNRFSGSEVNLQASRAVGS